MGSGFSATGVLDMWGLVLGVLDTAPTQSELNNLHYMDI